MRPKIRPHFTFQIVNTAVSFIKDKSSGVIHRCPHECPLHNIVKDIVYMQAQKGRAGISGILL
jgi:hypothetical protein